MSINLSQQRRAELLSHIEEIRAFLKKSLYDENARQLASYLNDLEREVKGKKYGLVFEEHKESIDETLENHLPVLTEEKDLFVDNGGELNFLLEGDNLASLKLLEKTHKGKIDVIYIDPPYNTGNKDFIYDDDFVDSADSFRHSKWLSFMEKRLKIARELMNEKGVIFISIDDNEQSDLKLLCDEIFGDKNYISDIIWNSRKSVSNDAIISMNHNYTLLYTKNIKEFNLKKNQFKLPDNGEGFSNPDNDPRGLWKADPFDSPGIRPNLTYKIKNPNTGIEYLPPEGRCWRTGEKEYKDFLADNRIIFGKTGNSKPQLKRFLSEAQLKGLTPKSIWDDCGTATNGTQELQEIFGSKVFDTPKPVDFIRKTLQLSTFNSPFSTILDFFAGSGTTGHAVLKLNAEDGGHRRFILCTNNENSICRDITYERLRTVITGKRKDGSEYSEGLSGSLKYFKVDFVEITEKEYYEYADKLLLHVRELVELENAVNFEGNSRLAIVLTDEELEAFFAQTLKQVQGNGEVKTLYLGHDLLLSKEEKSLLKKRGIQVKIIPQYYYTELNG